MHPALSVLLLTTLIGAGQGLFLALFAVEIAVRAHQLPMPPQAFFVVGGLASLALTAAGLAASFFHLGRPMRGWRAAARWRTSWLSREVIVLPLFMVATLLWGAAHAAGAATFVPGLLAAVLAVALYVCTGMIYASVRAIQEWASALTPLNYLLLGCASGTMLAAAHAALVATDVALPISFAALVLTVAGALARIAALRRNRRLRPRSTLQTAIGVRHPVLVQRAQGSMGGSFNTREFFHGASESRLRAIGISFPIAAFAVPALILLLVPPSATALTVAFAFQYAGLLAERWYFFAEANHPQNLYYQAIS
jgi:sulfite dehydrogenase (quinone) subunit SoeC